MAQGSKKKVTLLLTEEEYSLLQRVSSRRGLRVSEFASGVAVGAANASEKDLRISMGVGSYVHVFLPGKG